MKSDTWGDAASLRRKKQTKDIRPAWVRGGITKEAYQAWRKRLALEYLHDAINNVKWARKQLIEAGIKGTPLPRIHKELTAFIATLEEPQ